MLVLTLVLSGLARAQWDSDDGYSRQGDRSMAQPNQLVILARGRTPAQPGSQGHGLTARGGDWQRVDSQRQRSYRFNSTNAEESQLSRPSGVARRAAPLGNLPHSRCSLLD